MKSADENANLLTKAKPTLVFVYNAESGFFNLAFDVAHKIFSPQTYNCNLCAITHGNFGMKTEWREYLDTLENPLEFLHADELKRKYHIENVELPAVFVKEIDELEMLIDSTEINSCRTIGDLKRIINEKLDEAV